MARSRTLCDSLFRRGRVSIDKVNIAPISLSQENSNVSDALIALYIGASRPINFPTLTELFTKIPASVPHQHVLSLVAYIRDPRNGRGEREIGRRLLQMSLVCRPEGLREWFKRIPEFGRWDDLFYLFPGAVDLRTLKRVRNNYCYPCLSLQTLSIAREVQTEIVQFAADSLVECFALFMKGTSPGLLPKWLPTENSRCDRQTNAVSSICKTAGITIHDYRVIYLNPLRAASRVTERLMCSRSWDQLEYSDIPGGCVQKNKRAFARRGGPKYRKYVMQKQDVYIARPETIVQKYLSKLMNNGKAKNDSEMEASWLATMGHMPIHSKEVILCLRGDIYQTPPGVDIMMVSYALTVALVLSRGGSIKTWSAEQECFVEFEKSSSLLESITHARRRAGEVIPKEKVPQGAVVIGHGTPPSDHKAELWWDISVNKLEKVSRKSIIGFRTDIYHSLLTRGKITPKEDILKIRKFYNIKGVSSAT